MGRQSSGSNGRILISGASFAGLAAAYWMNKLGYQVTVVDIARNLRKGGTPVDIKQSTVGIVQRMGLLDAVRSRSLPPRVTEFKNDDDATEALLPARQVLAGSSDEEYEIDRDELLDILFRSVDGDVDFVFGRSITRLQEEHERITAWFDDGSTQEFALVLGCDGNRSNTRRLVFPGEESYSHFLKNYFLIKVVEKSFIESNKTLIYNVPGKTVMLNSYDGKTDIVFGFHSKHEIVYDHRDKAQQRRIVRERFAMLGWKTPGLLEELDADDNFYFDKLCQIKMPSWSKGRVVLVGDAAYCPSPAAGMGGSMAIVGAAALGDAFQKHGSDYAAAFRRYDESLRPFVHEVQEHAVSFGLAMFAPETQAAIHERNRRLSELAGV